MDDASGLEARANSDYDWSVLNGCDRLGKVAHAGVHEQSRFDGLECGLAPGPNRDPAVAPGVFDLRAAASVNRLDPAHGDPFSDSGGCERYTEAERPGQGAIHYEQPQTSSEQRVTRASS
jgi:hypothetical protein